MDEKELMKTAKSTPDDEMTPELQKYLAEARKRTKEKINTVLRALGLIAAVLIFLVAFDVLYEGTVFGAIFSNKDFKAYWDAMVIGDFYDDWLYWSTWLPVTILTAILISLFVMMSYIIAFNVKDLISTIKNFFNIGEDVTKELTGELRNVAKESGLGKLGLGKKKKSLFDDDDEKDFSKYDLLKEEEEEKPKISKKEEKLRKEIEKLNVSEEQIEADKKANAEPRKEKLEMTEKEINDKIDKILNDQSLTTEEAQRQVTELEKRLTNKSNKKPLF
jgi:hypothetical protein